MSVLASPLLAVALVAGAAQDTVRSTLVAVEQVTLDLAEFTQLVRERHPVVRQARLAVRQASAELLMARGGIWDPVLTAAWDRKRFKDDTYYDYVTAGVKIPTPLGVEFKLGYERTSGSFFNPDRRTPNQGLLVAGITVPLARGVITDARRTAVAQAIALRDGAEAGRAAMINKLLFAAAKDYAFWYEAERRRAIADTGIVLATFRLDAIRARVRNGDAAAIDTVEARLEVERRRVTQLEAAAAAFAARQTVNVYLWDEAGGPLELAPDARPDLGALRDAEFDTTAADNWMARAMREHPDIRKALAKLRDAEAARRLARQELLPMAQLEASAIGDDSTTNFTGGWPQVGENYKLGLEAKSALLLMKERGKATATGAKVEMAGLDASLTSRDVRATILTAINDVILLGQILERQRAAVAQARRLLEGEQRRFEAGESTLFLVNTRERTLLDETIKQVSYEAKYAGSRAALAFALGEPGDLPAR